MLKKFVDVSHVVIMTWVNVLLYFLNVEGCFFLITLKNMERYHVKIAIQDSSIHPCLITILLEYFYSLSVMLDGRIYFILLSIYPGNLQFHCCIVLGVLSKVLTLHFQGFFQPFLSIFVIFHKFEKCAYLMVGGDVLFAFLFVKFLLDLFYGEGDLQGFPKLLKPHAAFTCFPQTVQIHDVILSIDIADNLTAFLKIVHSFGDLSHTDIYVGYLE